MLRVAFRKGTILNVKLGITCRSRRRKEEQAGIPLQKIDTGKLVEVIY